MKISVIGAGAMGSGIAQVAAKAGHTVVVYDTNGTVLERSKDQLKANLKGLVAKGKMSQSESDQILERHMFTDNINAVKGSGLVVEAVVEQLQVKQDLFVQLENLVDETTILATNTSSLSIASIARVCKIKERVLGIHFFNPATIMPLVEVIPAVSTGVEFVNQALALLKEWGKVTVLAKDTPGFIVNKVARPYYGEALRIYEEGIADFATIDWAMKHIGGFKMGPFELMDFIGNDVNYSVTKSVFEGFYNDPRYKPSFTQRNLSEAGFLGRKSGRGYYDYAEGTSPTVAKEDVVLGQFIFNRIFALLVNEAYDTLFWNIASKEHIELAVTKGVNYPKGLFAWAEEYGLEVVRATLSDLYENYKEDRYRMCPLLHA